MTQFEQPFVKMVGEGLTNLQTKANSAEANFSTSESTHSKDHKKGMIFGNELQNQMSKIQINQCQVQNQQSHQQTHEVHHKENRLFTFMDQREAEKKFIQSFISKKSSRHLPLHLLSQENNLELLNKANAGIEKIIEDSRQKREDFLKKLLCTNSRVKQSKSITKFTRLSKSKTPRNLPNLQQRSPQLMLRNRSKTPKFEQHRSITPKQERQKRLSKASSNFDKDFKKHICNFKHKQKRQSKQTFQSKRQVFQINQTSINQYDNTQNSVNKLIKKKKQLEKKLLEINQSLLVCKKKNNNAANKNNPIKNSCKTNRKKSTNKLSKF